MFSTKAWLNAKVENDGYSIVNTSAHKHDHTIYSTERASWWNKGSQALSMYVVDEAPFSCPSGEQGPSNLSHCLSALVVNIIALQMCHDFVGDTGRTGPSILLEKPLQATRFQVHTKDANVWFPRQHCPYNSCPSSYLVISFFLACSHQRLLG